MVMALPLGTITSSNHAKISTFYFGLKMSLDAEFSSVCVESDAQPVINQLTKDEVDLASDGNLIDEVKGCLNQFQRTTSSMKLR